jgi:nucleoside diphosphate kinase
MVVTESLTSLISDNIKKAQKETIFFADIYSNLSAPEGENEFLFFIKPEITIESSTIKLENILEMIQSKIESFGFNIQNIKILTAKYLKQYNIIAQHYGVINKISTKAVLNMSDTAKDKFKEIYSKSISDAKVLGGSEFLEQYPDFNANSLDFLLQNKKTVKLAGGTYSLDVKIDNEIVYVINGFHPRQLEQFIAKGRSIIVFTLSGDINWSDARANFIGSTFPESANQGSIRKELLIKKEILGLDEVSQGLNGVHLSAGPVEALIELCRYNSNFSNNEDIKDYTDFSFGKKLAENFEKSNVDKIISNVNVLIEGKNVSIFDLTEEKNADEAINILKKYFN